MIAYLNGNVLLKSTDGIIIDVQGVGYHIHVSLNTFYEIPIEGMPVQVHIYTHVREDQITLFGFLTMDEKILFQQLLKVNGIGPKLALTILSGISAKELAEAIANEDADRLKNISGIGQKTAQRIILDLKGKLILGDLRGPVGSASRTYDEALSALLHLGYTRGEAQKALDLVGDVSQLTLSGVVRESLKQLGK